MLVVFVVLGIGIVVFFVFGGWGEVVVFDVFDFFEVFVREIFVKVKLEVVIKIEEIVDDKIEEGNVVKIDFVVGIIVK